MAHNVVLTTKDLTKFSSFKSDINVYFDSNEFQDPGYKNLCYRLEKEPGSNDKICVVFYYD